MPDGREHRERLWTVAEIAEEMRVSNMTVYRLIKRGELHAIRVGRNFRVRDRDLQAYLTAAEFHGEREDESGS